MKKMKKKNQTNLGTPPVPRPKVFFTTIFTLENTSSPGTGVVQGFFLNFFLHFFQGLYVYFVFEKKLAGHPLSILSNKILI